MATDEEPAAFDKQKIAVALSYNMGKDEAPKVAASGKGLIAQAIIEMARKNNVLVREDPDLAQLLSKLEIDMPIPLEAYTAVAEIISYVYKANGKAKSKK
jgi:flagellar biosynthesis protein